MTVSEDARLCLYPKAGLFRICNLDSDNGMGAGGAARAEAERLFARVRRDAHLPSAAATGACAATGRLGSPSYLIGHEPERIIEAILPPADAGQYVRATGCQAQAV